MSRRLISSLMIVCLLALFGATYLCSRKTETAFRQQLAQLNRSYAGLLRLELLDYRRGLLISEAQTRLHWQQQSWPLQHRLRHLPWKAQMQTAFAPVVADSPLKQLQLQTDVALDGSFVNHFELPELQLVGERSELGLQGLQAKLALSGGFASGQLQLSLDRLQITEAQQQLRLTNLQLDSCFAAVAGIPLGDGQLQLAALELWQDGQREALMNGLAYRLETRQREQQLVSQLALQLERLRLGGEEFSQGKLQLRIDGVEVAAVRQLLGDLRQLQSDLQDEPIDPLILQLQLLGFYSQLFQKGLTVALPQLELHSATGQLTGDGELELRQLDLSSGQPGFEQLAGQARLRLDLPLLQAGYRAFNRWQRPGRDFNPALLNEQAEQLAGGLVQKGILVRREGGYRLDFTLRQGQAVLNGQPFRWQ